MKIFKTRKNLIYEIFPLAKELKNPEKLGYTRKNAEIYSNLLNNFDCCFEPVTIRKNGYLVVGMPDEIACVDDVVKGLEGKVDLGYEIAESRSERNRQRKFEYGTIEHRIMGNSLMLFLSNHPYGCWIKFENGRHLI